MYATKMKVFIIKLYNMVLSRDYLCTYVCLFALENLLDNKWKTWRSLSDFSTGMIINRNEAIEFKFQLHIVTCTWGKLHSTASVALRWKARCSGKVPCSQAELQQDHTEEREIPMTEHRSPTEEALVPTAVQYSHTVLGWPWMHLCLSPSQKVRLIAFSALVSCGDWVNVVR